MFRSVATALPVVVQTKPNQTTNVYFEERIFAAAKSKERSRVLAQV